MIYSNGPTEVRWVGSVDALSNAVLAFQVDMDNLLATPLERFTRSLKRLGWHQSTGLARESPAVVTEDPDRHQWDKTRDDIGWWWLWEEDHECW